MSQRPEPDQAPTPKRLTEGESSPVGELLRKVQLPEPQPGARERSWQGLSGARARGRLRAVAWIPASALALVVLVAGAFVLAHPPLRPSTQLLSTPPTETAALRFGDLDLELFENTAARISSEQGRLEAQLLRGGLRVRPVGARAGASKAAVSAGRTQVEGTSFEMRIAADESVSVAALEDSVEVMNAGEVTRLRPGERWPSANDAKAAAAPAPSPAPTSVVASAAAPTPPVRRTGSSAADLRAAPSRLPARPRAAPVTPPISAVNPGPVEAPPPEVAPSKSVAGPLGPTDAERWVNAHRLMRSRQFSEALSELDALAEGSGPYAGMALYEGGRVRAQELNDVMGAQHAFAEYRQRFPAGPLRQEVELSALQTEVASRQLAAGLASADAFLSAYPRSERADEVRLLRAHLLRERGQLAEARAAYEQLAARPSAFGAEALFFGAYCARELGDEAAARTSLETYLERNPEGAHRADALRALGRTPQ